MQLISARFFLLVALTCVFHALLPKRQRWIALLASSVLFYSLCSIPSLILILIFTLSSYLLALALSRREGQESESVIGRRRLKGDDGKRKSRIICAFSILLMLCLWIFARELGGRTFIGLSFYSLRVIAYLVDVYRKRITAEKNILKYSLFVTFFPLGTLGPVANYRDIGASLFSGELADAEERRWAILRIALGVFKKVVIANALSAPLAEIASSHEKYTGAYVLFLLVFYSVEIYCDFSGGIDICIGVAMLFKVRLPENFECPFSSVNLREFWNRWHITLGEWFEIYVFYPISLSRPVQRLSRHSRKLFGTRIGKRLPLYAATLFTWCLTGLWHGGEGHFLAWGLINGALVLLSTETSRFFSRVSDRHPAWRDGDARILLGRIRAFFIVGAVRLLDVYRSLPLTARMLATAFYGTEGYRDMLSGGIFEVIPPHTLLVTAAAILIIFFIERGGKRLGELSKKPILAAALVALIFIATATFGTYGLGFDASDFIYSHFNGG